MSSRVSGCKVAPPLFEMPMRADKNTTRVAHMYNSTPQSGSFRCAGYTLSSQIEYKTAVTIAGDVYTFKSEFIEVPRVEGTNMPRRVYKEAAVIRFAGSSCAIVSYRNEEMSYISSSVKTADSNSTCRLCGASGC